MWVGTEDGEKAEPDEQAEPGEEAGPGEEQASPESQLVVGHRWESGQRPAERPKREQATSMDSKVPGKSQFSHSGASLYNRQQEVPS